MEHADFGHLTHLNGYAGQVLVLPFKNRVFCKSGPGIQIKFEVVGVERLLFYSGSKPALTHTSKLAFPHARAAIFVTAFGTFRDGVREKAG